jgi:hypothetical protein
LATEIKLCHPTTGLIKKGYVGFSWTTLFFGPFPALFRGDLVTFILVFLVDVLLSLPTYGAGAEVAGIVWAFLYNGYYTRRLIERGYRLADTAEHNALAQWKLELTAPMPTPGSI